MNKRVKKKVVAFVSLEQAQDASELFAKQLNKLDKIEAKMNEEINKIRSKYQDEITELKESLEEPQETLRVYAEEQRTNWGKKKSVELLHTVIGFRTGTPKVTKQKGFSWEAVTELAVKLYPQFVRTKSELDKEGIIAMSSEDGFNTIKQQLFIDVVQDETFYVEAKKEELAPAE